MAQWRPLNVVYRYRDFTALYDIIHCNPNNTKKFKGVHAGIFQVNRLFGTGTDRYGILCKRNLRSCWVWIIAYSKLPVFYQSRYRYPMLRSLSIYLGIRPRHHKQCFRSALTLWGSGSSFLGECGSESGSSFSNECGSMRTRILILL
jgi:hypothetical protein